MSGGGVGQASHHLVASADINECTSLREPCRSGFSCINTVGSYTCQRNPLVCSRGYHANEEGSECVGKAGASLHPHTLPIHLSAQEALERGRRDLRVSCLPAPQM